MIEFMYPGSIPYNKFEAGSLGSSLDQVTCDDYDIKTYVYLNVSRPF